MKKNININVFGTLYHIDEDAYELLHSYQDNMRCIFSQQEGGEEIADDIDLRIAELLQALKSKGVIAITIDHVKEIIDHIGSPEEIAKVDAPHNSRSAEDSSATKSDTPAASSPEEAAPSLSKRLLRDPDDKIIGGVLSGITHYIGAEDPTILRILFVLLTIFTWTTLAFVYLLLWVLIPVASTPEDFLRMHRKPITISNIRDQIIHTFRKKEAH